MANDTPCWLTLCGTSGGGKTHCADAIFRSAIECNRISVSSNRCEFYIQKIWWPGFINELRAGRESYERLKDTSRWPLLYLDEIGATRDTTGFVADQLYVITAQRENKWTIVTSNLTFAQIGEVDTRIASRCLRNDGIVVEINTVDYSTRISK